MIERDNVGPGSSFLSTSPHPKLFIFKVTRTEVTSRGDLLDFPQLTPETQKAIFANSSVHAVELEASTDFLLSWWSSPPKSENVTQIKSSGSL